VPKPEPSNEVFGRPRDKQDHGNHRQHDGSGSSALILSLANEKDGSAEDHDHEKHEGANANCSRRPSHGTHRASSQAGASWPRRQLRPLERQAGHDHDNGAAHIGHITAPPSQLPPAVHHQPGDPRLTEVEAEVVDPGDKVVDLGPLSPDLEARLQDELDQLRMAHTGTDTDALLLFAVTAFLIGSAMIVIATRRRSVAVGGLPPPWPRPNSRPRQ
jgi:hypothetical protein